MTAAVAIPSRPSTSYNAMSWARDSSLSAMLENNFFDHPTPTSFSHLSAMLSTSARSYTTEFGSSLPRLEQNYCQGYSCCGQDLQDLHGLLEHFEEHHVLEASPAGGLMSPPSSSGLRKAAVQRNAELNKRGGKAEPPKDAKKVPQPPVSAALDAGAPFSMEDDLDMELDTEDLGTLDIPSPVAGFATPSRPFSSALRHGLDALSLGNTFNKNLRRSQSPTASVSSPDISTPSTPLMESDFESDFDPSSSSASVNNLFAPLTTITPSMLLPAQYATQPTISSADIDTDDEDAIEASELNARRRQPLQPRNGGVLPDFSKNQATIVMGSDPNMTTLNPLKGDGASTQFIAPPPTLPSGRAWVAPAAKPFKCPVPGCDKAYKQQNGLKYHRLHGHCNNRAREGGDENGRETIEEKPYGCYVGAGCGKRYKNMNGLRYHYQHSGPHGQIGLEMLSQGTHPPPIGHTIRHKSGSAASSRAASRNASPAPTPTRELSAFSFN